jgi:hypothetical protein
VLQYGVGQHLVDDPVAAMPGGEELLVDRWFVGQVVSWCCMNQSSGLATTP